MLGDRTVFIRDNDLRIGDEVYEGTVRLCELLPKQAPGNFVKRDVEDYVRIMRQTKAHLKPDGTIKPYRDLVSF